jgi:hypothetical protein
LQTFGFSLIIVRRKPADPSAVPAAEGFSNCAMPMTCQGLGKVPWNISVIVKSSTGGFSGPKSRLRPVAVRRPIAAKVSTIVVDNHPSRSGKDDGVERWCVRRPGMPVWDQVW